MCMLYMDNMDIDEGYCSEESETIIEISDDGIDDFMNEYIEFIEELEMNESNNTVILELCNKIIECINDDEDNDLMYWCIEKMCSIVQ